MGIPLVLLDQFFITCFKTGQNESKECSGEPVDDCITHNATWPLNDNNGGNLSDYMQLPLEPQNVLYNFFYIQDSIQDSTPVHML